MAGFEIQVRFLGGLTAPQQRVFETAAARWLRVITGDLPSVRIDGEVIDDVLITAQGVRIDGLGDPITGRNILGQAAPRFLRPDSRLPAMGFMEFDTADLASLEAEGSLQNVIIHEMGHVLGIGTIWSRLGLLQGANTPNPVFLGSNAMREYATLIGADSPTPVPVANEGGPGTRDGHWRERVFGSELMTGTLNVGTNSISRMTIASLQDLGYAVNLDAADEFQIPSAFELAVMGFGADPIVCRRCGAEPTGRVWPEPIVLPESTLVP